MALTEQDLYNIYVNSQENIDTYVSGISPHKKPEDMFNIFKEMSNNSPKYIRDLIRAENNIIYEKEFIEIVKSEHVYSETFSHTGDTVVFNEERLLFTMNDFFTFDTHDTDLRVDVYVGGVKISKDDYYISKALGSTRIYIISSLVEENDDINFIVRKIYNSKNGNISWKMESSNYNSFSIDIDTKPLGDYYGNNNALALYKVDLFNDGFRSMNYIDDYTISTLDDKKINLTVTKPCYKNEIFLLMNLYNHYSRELTISDYKLSYELTTAKNVLDYPEPIPYVDPRDLNVFINGYKLIYGKDYNIGVNNSGSDIIKFSDSINSGSRIEVYTDFKDLEFNKYIFEESFSDPKGLVSFLNENYPIDDDYIEVFIDRKRVNRNDKETINDCVFRFKNSESLKNVEIYTNINNSDRLKELLADYSSNKTTRTSIVENMGLSSFITYYENANPIIPNTNTIPETNIFSNVLDSIQIVPSVNSTMLGNKDVNFKVVGVLDNLDTMDLTSISEVTGYDRFAIGSQTITATIEYGNNTLTETLAFTVNDKKESSLLIELETNNIVEQYGDVNYEVFLLYADFSKKDITDSVTVSPYDTSILGEHVITVDYTDNDGDTFTKDLYITVVSEDIVSIVEIIPTYKRNTIDSTIELVITAIYSDGSSRDITADSTITGFNGSLIDTSQVINVEYTDEPNTVYSEDLDLTVMSEVLNTANVIEFDGTVLDFPVNTLTNMHADYVQFKVRNEEGTLLSINKTTLSEDNIYFGSLVDNELVIGIFYDINGNKINEEVLVAKSKNV